MFWQNANTISNTIWASFESIGILVAVLLYLGRKFKKLEKNIDRLNYAIFNDGKTGLKNVVDDNIPQMVTDIAVIKTKLDLP